MIKRVECYKTVVMRPLAVTLGMIPRPYMEGFREGVNDH